MSEKNPISNVVDLNAAKAKRNDESLIDYYCSYSKEPYEKRLRSIKDTLARINEMMAEIRDLERQ